MIRIFLDANVLLRFYDSSRAEYKKLIRSLDVFATHFFVTKQVANEVIRNRLGVAVRAARGIEKKLQDVATLPLPEHFEVPTSLGAITAKEWNSQRIAFTDQHKSLSKNLHAYFSALLKSVSEGTDNVSQTLNKLFQHATSPTAEQCREAVDRKEFGNPPGKKGDPVGDQLTWLLFRDSLTGDHEIWLVTNDSDYYEEFGGKLYLNSFLFEELAAKLGRPPAVTIIKDLGTAIRDLQGRLKTEVIPEETLARVEREESELSSRNVVCLTVAQCPKCKTHGSMVSGGLHPSQFGGWTYWDVCTKCGFRMDSGEPYDD